MHCLLHYCYKFYPKSTDNGLEKKSQDICSSINNHLLLFCCSMVDVGNICGCRLLFMRSCNSCFGNVILVIKRERLLLFQFFFFFFEICCYIGNLNSRHFPAGLELADLFLLFLQRET